MYITVKIRSIHDFAPSVRYLAFNLWVPGRRRKPRYLGNFIFNRSFSFFDQYGHVGCLKIRNFMYNPRKILVCHDYAPIALK